MAESTVKQEPPVKQESAEITSESTESKSVEIKSEPTESKVFQCSSCPFRVDYEYFGRNIPYTNKFMLLEDAYVIEDPFSPPKQGKFIILGTLCVKCRKAVCKDISCSIYYDETYCIKCAKLHKDTFPMAVQEKLNKIV